MDFVKPDLKRVFSRPKGVLGWFGGMIMARRNQRMARHGVKLLDVQPGDKVLEIGFGPGVGIELLTDYSPAQSVAGIDPSKAMCKQARTRNAADIKDGSVSLQRSSVEHIAFADNTFDKAMAVRSMGVWPDAITGLREVRRVLQPHGKLVLGVTHQCEQTREELTELLTAAGFSSAKVIDKHGEFWVLATKPVENPNCQR